MTLGAPITLTPAQFAKTPAAQKGGTYAQYVKYVTNARGSRGVKGAPSAGGLDPRSDAQIAQIVNSFVSRIRGQEGQFHPQTDAQMQTEAGNYVDSRINPMIDKITGEASARATRGMDAIRSLSTQLQSAEGPAADNATHNALLAAAARSAVGQSLGQTATQEGGQQQDSIAAKLQAAGNGGVSDVYAQNAGGLGKTIGGTIGTYGATGAHEAIDKGAAASGYASALPGITALAGVRSGRILQEQTNAGVKSNIAALEATVPGLVSGIFENLKGRDLSTRQARANLESQGAQLGATLSQHMGDQEIQKATSRQGFGLDLTKLGVTANIADQANKTRAQIAKDNADARIAAAAAKSATAASAATAKNQKAAQSALVKANSVAIAYLNKNVKPVPIYQTVLDTSTTPPTNKQVITGYKGYPGYYDTIHGIESQIAPILGPYATAADIVRAAQRIVNASPHYKPGMNGRPGAGAPPAAGTTHGSHGSPP